MKAKYVIADLCEVLEDTDAFLRSLGNVHGSVDGKPLTARAMRRRIRRRLRTAYDSCDYAVTAQAERRNRS